MGSNDLILIGGALIAGSIILSKGKIGQPIGKAAGKAAGGAAAGFVEGAVEGVLVDPYKWALNYDGYIPIIDDVARAAVSIKQLGNKERWFW